MPVDDILRVPYNVPGSPYWQWVNIYTRLNQERIIFLSQPITTGLANSLVSSMLYLDSDDKTKPIYLYINSPGDVDSGMMSIASGLAIYDTMQHIKSEIITICLGNVAGMATLILSAGTKGKRASLPNASVILTQPRMSTTRGQASDIQISADEVLAKRTLVVEILARNTGQTTEKILKDLDRIVYMTPQEAKDYGLIDRILETS